MTNLERTNSGPWPRIVAIIIIITALLFSVSSPALAITHGESDGTGHSYVGSIVVHIPDRGYFQWCSGTLISDDVFLTASHCTALLDQFLVNNPGTEVLVTFDPTISENGIFFTGTWHTNPNYNNFQGKLGHSDPGDIAVIVLDQAPGIVPARLPTASLLDELKDDQLLKGTRFTEVGYGDVRETHRTGFQGLLSNLDRNRVEQEFLALTPAWLTISMNPSTGSGGTCYGDSGGPHFIHLDGVETNIVAAVTVTGDAPCKATDVTYRTDTESARNFLADYVDLP